MSGLNRTTPPLRSKLNCGCSVGAWGLVLIIVIIALACWLL